MANDNISVEISIEEKAALRALTKLTKSVDKFGDESTKSIKKTDKAMDSFKGNLAAIATSGAIKAIGNGLKNLAVGSFEAAASAEKINTQLEVLTGSTEKAADLFKELTDFSAKTPFQLQGIAEASASLLSFGFSADSVKDRIAAIGEVAAGSNSDLKEVALIYGQVAAAGKLTGERLLQLQERAVPIGAALAKTLGVAETEVKDLVSAGVVGFPEFEKAFNSMGEAGGLFEGAIQKQSATISGVLSTLSDNFFILQTEIGKTFAPQIVEGAQQVIQAFQGLTKVVIENKDAIANAIGFVGDYVSTYAQLAEDIAGVETPLEKLDTQIAKLIDRQQAAKKSAVDARESMGSFFGVFDSDKTTAIARSAVNVAKLEEEIKSLLEQRKNLVNTEAEGNAGGGGNEAEKAALEESKAINAAKVEDVKQTDAKILEQRKLAQAELNLLKEEEKLKESEQKLASGDLGQAERELEIENIRLHEENKAKIATDIQSIKDKKIRDARLAELAEQKRVTQESIAISVAQAKAQKQIEDERVANRMKMVQGFGIAAQQASQLARRGSSEQKALAIASSTINTYAAATRAFRDYPYPANIAVMATTIATGLNTVAKIQQQSFQNGGIVGGNAGATNGTDNTTANVRTGEMVLNGNQQRTLFDIASGRSTGGDSGLISSINRLANQAVVVEIDGREIARTVRSQRLEGFEI